MHQLLGCYDQTQEKIDSNDGRLTTGSSAELDLAMEDQSDIAEELRKRLGFDNAVKRIVQEKIRQYHRKRWPGLIVAILLRIGLVSMDYDGDIRWPFHMPEYWGMFWFHIKSGPWVYIFRNHPGVVKWQENRFLPRRWGFGVIGFEFGDRGSNHASQDMDRESLFRRKGNR